MELEDINIVINAYKRLLKKFTDLGASKEICQYYKDEIVYWQSRKKKLLVWLRALDGLLQPNGLAMCRCEVRAMDI